MQVRYFPFVFLLLTGVHLNAQNSLDSAIKKLLRKPEYKNASVGIMVTEETSGETLYSLNPNKLMIPASTLKLITSGTALELLGADYRFKTRIAYTGAITNEVLDGNLVLIGGADPALGSEYFQKHYFNFLERWAQIVKDAGIKRINGNLILDASIYDSEKVPATWIWEDIGNYYGAGANAFSIYDNLFRISFRSPATIGGQTQIENIYPHIEGVKIMNEVLAADNNRDNAYVFGSPLDNTRVIRGTIPANRRSFTIKAAMHHPEKILATSFEQALLEKGVFVMEKVMFQTVDHVAAKTIYIQESPKLSEIVKVLNYESVNLFAEHLLKQLAVEEYGQGNREKSLEIVKTFWKEKGFPMDEIFMEDGSGLSHFNTVSPAFFTRFLTTMATNNAFVESLPVAGVGTFKYFDTNQFPGNTLQAKSGSMTRVRCYSGYLTTDKGNRLVFSFMFNHFAGSQSTLIKEIEQLFVILKQTY
ncbi:MAG TPA: D-alanyl-D-alanine carboxypeptidase/D-alanyl-D-alanine-endopeptidase [Draconibacterium sp.]|nr:D-alanyl-D-alanine carboxypeptidase/D-alanyl-D-alanine-endopeptidase [Draconibacterium sp.]